MANPSFVRGLVPVRNAYGRPYNGAFREYSVAAGNGTAIYIGDPVTTAGVGTGQTIDGRAMLDVVQAATGDIITGVVVGVKPVTTNSLPYRAASTQRVLYVCDDPDMLFEIQESSGGTPLAINDLGLNCNFVVAAGNTTTGYSGVTLDNSTEANTNTLDLKIMEFLNGADNAVGESAKWLVRINRHRYVNQLAGV